VISICSITLFFRLPEATTVDSIYEDLAGSAALGELTLSAVDRGYSALILRLFF
jgi:hypothetical protein